MARMARTVTPDHFDLASTPSPVAHSSAGSRIGHSSAGSRIGKFWRGRHRPSNRPRSQGDVVRNGRPVVSTAFDPSRRVAGLDVSPTSMMTAEGSTSPSNDLPSPLRQDSVWMDRWFHVPCRLSPHWRLAADTQCRCAARASDYGLVLWPCRLPWDLSTQVVH